MSWVGFGAGRAVAEIPQVFCCAVDARIRPGDRFVEFHNLVDRLKGCLRRCLAFTIIGEQRQASRVPCVDNLFEQCVCDGVDDEDRIRLAHHVGDINEIAHALWEGFDIPQIFSRERNSGDHRAGVCVDDDHLG